MGYKPTFDVSCLGMLLGTVGASGGITAGNATIGPIGFTPLPGRTTADVFTSADVGRRITIMGAGPGGSLLITTVATFIDSQHVTLANAPSTSVADGIAAVTIFRPVRVKMGSMTFSENLTDASEGGVVLQQVNGEYPPVEGQPFLFTASNPALTDSYGTFWGGEIDSVDTGYEGFINGGQKCTETVCKCVSYKAVLQRRVMLGKQYSSTDIVSITADVCQQATADYIDYTVASNASISLLTVDDYTYLDQVLDALVTLASSGTTKYFWYIDHWRKVHVITETSSPAPWSVSDTGASDGNVRVHVTRTRTREKLANQVYAKASKALGDLQTQTFGNSFNGSPLPTPRRGLTLSTKAGITPKITVNSVAKKVWVSPVDPRNDTSSTVTIPAGYDWAWPEDSDYLFCDSSRPGIPSGGTGIVTFYPAGTAISHDLNNTSVSSRSAIQGGSGLHEAVETVDAPMSKAELDKWVTGHVAAFGIVPESVNVETYRPGLRRGMGLTVHLTEIGATANYVVESVSMTEEQGYVHWSIKASIGAFIGDWTGALIRAFGGDTSLGGGAGVIASGSVLEAQFVGGSGMLTVPYAAKVLVNGGSQSYTWAVAAGSSLPAGLSLDPATGIISGTPTAIGSYNFTIAVLDADGESVTADCHVEIVAAPSDGSAELVGTVTAFSAADQTGSRWVDAGGALHAVVALTISCNAYPKRVTIEGVSPQYGRLWHGWVRVDGPATVISLGAKDSASEIYPPTGADETVVFRAAVGTYDKNIVLTSLGAGNYASTSTTVYSPGSFGNTGSSSATAPTVNYFRTTAGAYQYTVTFQVTLPLSDPKFFFARLYNQTGAGTGGSFTPGGANAGNTAMGDWVSPTAFIDKQDHAGFMQLHGDVSTGVVDVTLGPWNVPSDGNNTLRLRFDIATRTDDGTGGTKTPQYTWPGGAQYADVVLDASKANIDLAYLDPTALDPSLVRDPTTGKLRTNTKNAANLVLNGEFDGAMTGWTYNVSNTLWLASGGYTTPGCVRFYGIANNQMSSQEFVVHPGDEIYFEAYAQPIAIASSSAPLTVWVAFYNNSGGFISDGGSLGLATVPYSASGFTQASAVATAPTGAATAKLILEYRSSVNDPNVGFWIIDSIFAKYQVSAGPGVKRNGKGGLQLNTGASIDVDGAGGAIVKNGTLGEAIFVGGALGSDLSKWTSTKVPFGFYFGLPSTTDPNIPAVIVNTADTPWRIYNRVSGSWIVQKTQAGDLVAGSIAALIGLSSPTISGGSLTISAGNTTVTISSTAALGVPGVSVRDTSGDSETFIGSAATIVRKISNPAQGVTINGAAGYIAIGNGAGTTKIITATSMP